MFLKLYFNVNCFIKPRLTILDNYTFNFVLKILQHGKMIEVLYSICLIPLVTLTYVYQFLL